MTRGIFILANDAVIDDVIALMESLREHSPGYPVMMIPYDDRHELVAKALRKYGVQQFPSPDVLADIDERAQRIFGKPTPMCRKFAAWSGPFDEFVFIDGDIVVLEDQADVFALLEHYEIVYCGSGAYHRLAHVFNEHALEVFEEDELGDLFNAGYFASKKSALSHSRLLEIMDEAAGVSRMFLMGDQSLLNYMALRLWQRRANIRDLAPEPGRAGKPGPHFGKVHCDAWAGTPALVTDGEVRFEDGSRVRHIHWAGFKDRANLPHLHVWLRYRYPNVVSRMVAHVYFALRRSQQSVDRRIAR
jgi:hypothetical protein